MSRRSVLQPPGACVLGGARGAGEAAAGAAADAPNADRKIQIESKAAIKVKLSGASPDYADALAMAHCSDGVVDFTTALSERGEAVTF
jgi:hypothetical protein